MSQPQFQQQVPAQTQSQIINKLHLQQKLQQLQQQQQQQVQSTKQLHQTSTHHHTHEKLSNKYTSSNIVATHYKVNKKIGEGSFGVIYEGKF